MIRIRPERLADYFLWISWPWCFGLPGVLGAAGLFLACQEAEDVAEIRHGSEQQGLVVGAGEAVGNQGEGRSPPAIIVKWEDEAPAIEGSHLVVFVRNTTKAALKAQIVALVSNPLVGRQEQVLADVVLDASTVQTIDIALDGLPIRTAGAPSMLMILARWNRPGPSSTNPNDVTVGQLLENYSDTRHITWSDDFKSASVRSDMEQVRVDSDRPTGVQTPVSLRRQISLSQFSQSEFSTGSVSYGRIVHPDDPSVDHKDIPYSTTTADSQ